MVTLKKLILITQQNTVYQCFVINSLLCSRKQLEMWANWHTNGLTFVAVRAQRLHAAHSFLYRHKVIVITHSYGSRQGVRYMSSGLKTYYVCHRPIYNGASLPTFGLNLLVNCCWCCSWKYFWFEICLCAVFFFKKKNAFDVHFVANCTTNSCERTDWHCSRTSSFFKHWTWMV